MRILVHFSAAMIGGHVISATTQAAALARRRNDVLVACDDGPLLSLIERYGLKRVRVAFPLGRLQGNYFFYRHTLQATKSLAATVRDFRPDMVSSYDVPGSVQASLCSVSTHVPVVQTICGGMVPDYSPPPSDGIIVFSQELADGLASRYGWTRKVLTVIPHRIDLNDQSRGDAAQDLNQLGWGPHTKGVLMTTRLNVNKEEAVRHFLAAMSIVAKRVPDARATVIGDGACYESLSTRAHEINRAAGGEIVRFTGSVPGADRFAQHASVILGVGRAAFEGMRHAKPTIIVGETGFAGEVAAENIEALAYYNFSGRNADTTSTPERLAEAILRILTDMQHASYLGSFGRSYLESSLDVDEGARRIEGFYHRVLSEYSPSPGWRLKRIAMFLGTVPSPAIRLTLQTRFGKPGRSAR
jgi:hypothetical protein